MNSLLINGDEITETDKINNEVETFYKSLYEKGDSKLGNKNNFNTFAKLESLSEADITNMDTPLTKDELFSTLKSCNDSAPGPDGIPYSIIKLTWNYYGNLLLESWNYAKEIKELTHSHRESYLRLIPKEGKDTKILKNWRPIALSNCDFKIITKTISRRLTNAVSNTISNVQTAYIPGRQITDNLHLMLHMLEKSSNDDIKSMLISLDAEKAFDSVEHWFIKAILAKLGLNKLVDIFNLLYKNQTVDILLNGGKA